MAIYNIKLSNIFYDYLLSMASFRFLQNIFTTHQTVRGQQEYN